MKRILCVTNESNHGGAERMLIWLANSLSKCNEYSVIFCNLDNNQPFYSLNEKVKLILFPEAANENFIYRNTIGFIKKCVFLNHLIKNEKIDLIINFNDHAMYNIILCKLLLGTKVLVSQRVDPSSITSITGKLRLKLIGWMDGFVCQTQSALEFFEEKIQKKSTVIFNPVYNKPSEFWNPEKTEDVIINVSRLELKQKRQDVLIKAFRIVHEKYPNLKLLLYGAKINEDYDKIMKLVEQLNLQNAVIYCGVSSNILDEMRKSKLFVLSSDYEGIPNAVLEAMSLGMPIVSTDCKPGGARMLLENKCGILVPCGDESMLAKAILQMLNNIDVAYEYGKKALIAVNQFDEINISREWERYINEIV